ncbi:11157_t:CDS:1, partial [Gigaspora margarita]
RIVKSTEEREEELVNESKEVLKEVKKHFMQQFRKWASLASNLPGRWKSRFQPIKELSP